jgi:ArsR family transcriptional regulator
MSNRNLTKYIDTLSKCEDIGVTAEDHCKFLIKNAEDLSNDTSIEKLSTIFNALGNKDRFLILSLLSDKDRCACEIEVALEKSQSALSRHISILEAANLIKGWKKGKFTHYTLVKSQFEEFSELFNIWKSSIKNWL